MNNSGFYPTQPVANQFYPYPTHTYHQQSQPMYQPEEVRQKNQSPNTNNNNVPMLPEEQSYIENIVRMNKGKNTKVYMTIEHDTKVFEGIIEAAGRDHIILSDPETGERYLLLMVYVDYLVFDEKINYSYPYGNSNGLANYPSR